MSDIDPADARPTPAFRLDVRRAMADVYEALAEYPAPQRLDSVSHLDGQAILSCLRASDLRCLTPQHLHDFAAHAPYTIGTVQDYKHFLPRLLELSFDPASSSLCPSIADIAVRLKALDWRKWPTRERWAITNLLLAMLKEALDHGPDEVSISDRILAAALLDSDLSAFLAYWLETRTPQAVLHLVVFLEEAHRILPSTTGLWWDVSPTVRAELARWLSSDIVEAVILGGVDLVGAQDQWRFDAADALRFILKAAMKP